MSGQGPEAFEVRDGVIQPVDAAAEPDEVVDWRERAVEARPGRATSAETTPAVAWRGHDSAWAEPHRRSGRALLAAGGLTVGPDSRVTGGTLTAPSADTTVRTSSGKVLQRGGFGTKGGSGGS